MTRQSLIHCLIASTLTATACGSSSPAASGDVETLTPPAAGQGLQLSMTSIIAPGQEIERCKFYQVPATGMNVNRATVRYADGSHHVLLYRTPYTAIPVKTLSGSTVSVDANGVFDCAEGAAADWDVDGIVAGAQSLHGTDAAHFPAGVAAKLAPGTVLIINTHYLNVTQKPLTAEARINLETIPDSEVTAEGGFLFFYNPFILVPPQGTAAATMSCPIVQDIHLVNGQSHMHRRGVSYEAVLTDPASPPTPLYHSESWENVPVQEWLPTGLELHAGQTIDYTCHYTNTEDRVVAQGLTTKDEMCMFLGSYYPRNRELEACPTFVRGKGATFVGNGTADASATLGCIADALHTPQQAGRQKLFGCVVDSCPGIAKPLTAFLSCRMSGPESLGCEQACAQAAPACDACVTMACTDDTSALSAAVCN